MVLILIEIWKCVFWVVEMPYKCWLGSVDSFACKLHWLPCWESVGASILACVFACLLIRLKKKIKTIGKIRGVISICKVPSQIGLKTPNQQPPFSVLKTNQTKAQPNQWTRMGWSHLIFSCFVWDIKPPK